MKFTIAAVAGFAAVAQASYASNVTYTTEVVTAYTTYCPAATELTYNGQTYTVTEATTLTISDCPCTISKPVYTTSSVVCSTCTAGASSSTEVPVYPTTYANGTAPVTSSVKATGGYTTSKASSSSAAAASSATSSTTSVPTAGAGKVAALSGAALAGLIGVAALL